MLITHLGSSPQIEDSAVIAPTAVICGNVKIGKNARILYGAAIVAEGGSIEIGDNCIVLENAVLRSTARHSLSIGSNVLIGPNAHVVGCVVEDNVFIATGASVFHGARLCRGSEVRINGVVHIKTTLPENATVPIHWVAVGAPAHILSPERHEEINAIQRPLNFPEYVYGVPRKPNDETLMPEIAERVTDALRSCSEDEMIDNSK